MFQWLKHAFAVKPAEAPRPTSAQAAAIDAVCRELIRRKMTLPAQMLFESSAPLNYVAGQFLRIAEPFLTLILDRDRLTDFTAFLEQRGSLEYICRRLEELEATQP